MAVRTGFWSSSTALDWEHGLVAGTGTLGAVLSGTTARHVVHVCHEEFFVPVNSAIAAPRIGEQIEEVRAAVLAADTDAAARITSLAAAHDGYDGRMIWTDPFVPIAALSWTPDEPSDASTYRRFGDFRTGRVGVEWSTAAGQRNSIALVPDRAAGTLALELFSTREMDGVLSLDLEPDEPGIGDYPSTDYGVFLRPSEPRYENGRLMGDVEVDSEALLPFVREHPPSPWQPTGARLEVDVSGDLAPRPVDAGVHVRLPAGVIVSLPIRVDLTGGLVGTTPLDGASHESLFGASSLDLHSGVESSVSYDDVLAGARAGDADCILAALELAFAAGRHTIISSTGALPPTLVGIWQGTRRPAWSGDWTQNGNVQHGGVASLVASGTPELFTSYLRAIFRHVEDYVENADRVFGGKGWLLPARFDSHGRSNHFATAYPHLYWMAGGAWVLRLAWDQFCATGDLETLREYAWPLARNVLDFATSVAFEDDAGILHFAPSYSPENTPANRTNPLAIDATMDVAAFRDAARLGIRIANLLGEDADRAEWESFADRLPPYRVADDGTFTEWLDPELEEQLAHRHASQLYPFWYEEDPAAQSPELRAAALETIRRKLEWRDERPWAGRDGRQEMAFGLVGLGLAAARLGDADAAMRCVESLARDFWRPNAVSTHDGDSIFNVDASGGLPAVVIEMLIQSQPGSVTLLPALPAAWSSGSIRGVRARGGVVIEELTWDAEAVTVALALAAGSNAARHGDIVTVSALGTVQAVDLSDGPRTLRLERPPRAAPAAGH